MNRALHPLLAVVSLIAFSVSSANAGISGQEKAIGKCITRILKDRGWTPTGSFIPWDEHSRIEFNYPDRKGARAKQTIYIFSVHSRNGSEVLVFGMLLRWHDGSDFEIAQVLERECHVPFVPMMT